MWPQEYSNVLCFVKDAATIKAPRGSAKDVPILRPYKAGLAVMQREEGLQLQPSLFQGLSETNRRLQVVLDHREIARPGPENKGEYLSGCLQLSSQASEPKVTWNCELCENSYAVQQRHLCYTVFLELENVTSASASFPSESSEHSSYTVSWTTCQTFSWNFQ